MHWRVKLLFVQSKSPTLGILLLLVFIFTMSMVLLNALIAVMSEAATEVGFPSDSWKYMIVMIFAMLWRLSSKICMQWLLHCYWYKSTMFVGRVKIEDFEVLWPVQAADKDGTKFLASKAEIIDELEEAMPSWLRKPNWSALIPQFCH